LADAAGVVAVVDVAVVAVLVGDGALLAVLADGDPLVGGAAAVDVVEEPQAAIKSATPARTTPIRRTVVSPSDLVGPPFRPIEAPRGRGPWAHG
jgi:hypothetical protein